MKCLARLLGAVFFCSPWLVVLVDLLENKISTRLFDPVVFLESRKIVVLTYLTDILKIFPT